VTPCHGLGTGRCGVYWRLDLGDGRSGLAKNHTTFANFDPGFWICCDCKPKTLDKVCAEPPQPSKARAKLGIQSWPTDFDVFAEGVESIGEPYVDIDYHGTGADSAEGGFADRNRVLAESAEEILAQKHSVLPKRRLVADDVRHRDLGLYKAPLALDLSTETVGKKVKEHPEIRRACSFTSL
jgi:hypothetical protein